MKKRLTALTICLALILSAAPIMAEEEAAAVNAGQNEETIDQTTLQNEEETKEEAALKETPEEKEESDETTEDISEAPEKEINDDNAEITASESDKNAENEVPEEKAALFTLSEESAVKAISPENNAQNVSVLSDISIVLEEDKEVEESDVTVEGENLPEYNLEIDQNNINIIFLKELPYKTEITVTVLGEAFKFITEKNPITTLFSEDFESAAALDRFENVGATPLNLYEIYDGKLLMKTHPTRLSNGGTPVLRSSKDNDILYIKGSENWDEYVVDIDVSNGWYTKADETGEYTDCEAMISVNTNRNDGSGMLSIQSYAGGWRAFWSYYLTDWVMGQLHNAEHKFQTNYRTVHHMTIDASTTDYTASLTNDLDGTLTHKVGWGNGAHPSGGVTLRSSWGRIVFDNLEVTDKGFLFTPDKIKNVKGKLILNFNDTVDETTLKGIKVSLNGKEQAVEGSLSEDGKSAQISVEGLNAGQSYDLTVENVKSRSGKTMNSKKELQFTVSDDFDLVKITPTENEQNVDVLSDIKIEFSQNVNTENAEEYISVENMTGDDYYVKAEGKVLTVVFKDALPYDSDITVNLKEGISSETGKVLVNGAARTFHTDVDKSNVLYEQNFDDIAINYENGKYNGVKFAGLTVDEINNTDKYYNSFRVENGALLMSLTWKIGMDHDDGRLRFIIDGSENWTDYEISADFMQNVPDVEKWVRGGFGLRYNGENSGNSAKVMVDW